MAGRSHTLSGALKHRWHFLIGSPAEFTVEARIFHSISLGVALLLFSYVPYDLLAGLHVAALSCIIAGTVFFYEYYRSRFLFHAHRSLLFGITGLLLLTVNYFANAGIAGSTDLIWPVYLLFLLAICPYRHMVVWVIVYLVVFGFVHVAEHLYPHLVYYPFRAGHGQFLDRITAFPIPVISIAIIIGLFRRSYDKERAIVAQRDQEKSRLLSILSHDLRAPFIQIQQYFELLNDDALSPAERAVIEQTLKQKNEQTLELVTNLLYWSRSQLDGFVMRLTPLVLSDLLESTLALADGISRRKGIALTTKIPPEIGVLADPDMLQVVVRNLLQNAVKFTATGGMITVEAEMTERSCSLSVTDNGVGINPAALDRLFSGAVPAFGTANEKGVGVGLQLCKEFMDRQGGSISVESKFATGSRFTITIPLQR